LVADRAPPSTYIPTLLRVQGCTRGSEDLVDPEEPIEIDTLRVVDAGVIGRVAQQRVDEIVQRTA
jgi:hypothetical protein